MYIGAIDWNFKQIEAEKERNRSKTKNATSYEIVNSEPTTSAMASDEQTNFVMQNDVPNDNNMEVADTEVIVRPSFNRQVIDKIAESVVRYRVSPTAAAAIATATLETYGLVTKENTQHVIDRSKLRRAIQSVGKNVFEAEVHYKLQGLYFDGRKDKTKMYIDKRIKNKS